MAASYVVMGPVTLVVNIPLALLIIKQGRPQAFGLTPPRPGGRKELKETEKGETRITALDADQGYEPLTGPANTLLLAFHDRNVYLRQP